MIKKSQNWYKREKNRGSYGRDSLYEGIIEVKILVHDVDNEQAGISLASNALNKAMSKAEEIIPSFAASENSNIYIGGVSLTPKSLQRR